MPGSGLAHHTVPGSFFLSRPRHTGGDPAVENLFESDSASSAWLLKDRHSERLKQIWQRDLGRPGHSQSFAFGQHGTATAFTALPNGNRWSRAVQTMTFPCRSASPDVGFGQTFGDAYREVLNATVTVATHASLCRSKALQGLLRRIEHEVVSSFNIMRLCQR